MDWTLLFVRRDCGQYDGQDGGRSGGTGCGHDGVPSPPHRGRAALEVAAPPSAHEDWPAARFGVPAHFIYCLAGQKPNPSNTASRPEGQGGGGIRISHDPVVRITDAYRP